MHAYVGFGRDQWLEGGEATLTFESPTIIETSAERFRVMVPESLRSSPMWVLWLPDELSTELEFLVARPPVVGELTSVDLMKRRATLEWTTSTHRICANVLDVLASLHWARADEDRIMLALVTSSRTAVGSLRVNEELDFDLQLMGTRCDHNYRPVREHTCDELNAASARSVLLGADREVDEEGRSLVRLVHRRLDYWQAARS